MEENRFTQMPQLAWKFQIVEGNHVERFVFKYSQLDSEERLGWLKQDFRNCGVIVDSIREIEEGLQQLLDRCVYVNLKSKEARNGKVYQNVYIQKEAEVPKSTEDVPFY